MRKILNTLTAVSLIMVILTACMVDSESLVPTFICMGATVILGITCMVRERL